MSDNKQSNKYRLPIPDKDVVLVMDALLPYLTEKYFKEHPRKAHRYYELYQIFGSAMGETEIVLEFATIQEALKETKKG